jgi:hypothetical protein
LHALGDIFAGGNVMSDLTLGILEGSDGLFFIIQFTVFPAIDKDIAESTTLLE